MLTIGIAIAISVLSTAIANIALPAMARELHATPAESIWVVNAYQLAVTVTLLPLAALGDIIGYRRVYMWGLCVFTVASLACGLADTLPLLIGGAGAAGLRRGRDHERQHRAGAVHRSRGRNWAEGSVDRAGGGDIVGGRAVAGGGDPGGGVVALAVHLQRAVRRAGGAGWRCGRCRRRRSRGTGSTWSARR